MLCSPLFFSGYMPKISIFKVHKLHLTPAALRPLGRSMRLQELRCQLQGWGLGLADAFNACGLGHHGILGAAIHPAMQHLVETHRAAAGESCGHQSHEPTWLVHDLKKTYIISYNMYMGVVLFFLRENGSCAGLGRTLRVFCATTVPFEF